MQDHQVREISSALRSISGSLIWVGMAIYFGLVFHGCMLPRH